MSAGPPPPDEHSKPAVASPPGPPRPGLWTTLGVIGFTIGALLSVGSWAVWQRYSVLQRRGITVTATVQSSSFALLRVRYRSANGRIWSESVPRPSNMRPGDPQPSVIRVTYDPKDPQVVQAASSNAAFPAVALGVPGIGLTIAGTFGLLAGWRAADRGGPPVEPGPLVDGGVPQAGWYRDPAWPAGWEPGWRWWTGQAWTRFATPIRPKQVQARPAVATLPLAATGWAVGGFVVSFASAFATGRGLRAAGAPLLAALLVSQAALWAVLFATCVTASRGWGSGDWRADFGFSLRWRDLWSGVGLFFLTGAFSALAAAPLLGHRSLRGTNTAIFDHFRHNNLTYAIVAALGIIGAPLFEELFFRGLLYQSLASRMPVGVAAVVQGVLFGLAHTNPAIVTHNVSVVVGIGAMGIALGLARHYYRRLGPGMVGHGLHNLLVTIVILAR